MKSLRHYTRVIWRLLARIVRLIPRRLYAGAAVAAVAFIFLFFYLYEFRAPKDFPGTAVVVVADGMGLAEVAELLKSEHIIQSPFWFTNFVILQKGERKVVGGEYYFERPMNVYEVAKRITGGRFNLSQLRTTIPEGSSIFDISIILKKQYPNFDNIHFLTIARSKEGYLFPDTYYFGADVRPEKVIDIMTSTFNERTKRDDIASMIQASGHSLKDLVTMASILEGEARQLRTRKIIAGILWERIRIGMPLQVDATFKYINGKGSSELTMADLKMDSPYNTYVNKGLPPGPISSPGLDSIMAAAAPIKTDYLFFLSDSEGEMHYAATLAEHVANKRRYLR